MMKIKHIIVTGCLSLITTIGFCNVAATVKHVEVTTVNPSDDIKYCLEVYPAKVSYKKHMTSNHHFISDKAHKTQRINSIKKMKQGIYLMNYQYIVHHPKQKDLLVTVFATSLSSNGTYSGVFTDGHCHGKIVISSH